MKNIKVAMRYAKAVYPIAKEQGTTAQLIDDVSLILMYIDKSREFKLFLNSPIVANNKKANAFKELFADKISELTLKFMLLLISKGREQLIDAIGQSLKLLYNIEKSITECQVISAFLLDEDTKNKIENFLKDTTKQNVQVDYSVDKSIIGGIKIRIADTIYDTSIQTKLKELKQVIINPQ